MPTSISAKARRSRLPSSSAVICSAPSTTDAGRRTGSRCAPPARDRSARTSNTSNADEVRHRFGWVGEQVIAAKYDPIAGWLDSNALIYKFAQNAPSAQILLGVPRGAASASNMGQSRRSALPNGTIAAPNVVIAAGANARAVGRTAGVELPIVLRPRQSFTTGWRHPHFPEHAPMIIGSAPFPHCAPGSAERRDLRLGIYAGTTKTPGTNTARTPLTTPSSIRFIRRRS